MPYYFFNVFNENIFSLEINFNVIYKKVFGLGNKTYEHYNEMGKYFDKRLEQLNGSRLIELGLGDDDGK
jgi:sulfite reductase alpha subunit-like flavoprotein